jgi:hypothetical protein
VSKTIKKKKFEELQSLVPNKEAFFDKIKELGLRKNNVPLIDLRDMLKFNFK